MNLHVFRTAGAFVHDKDLDAGLEKRPNDETGLITGLKARLYSRGQRAATSGDDMRQDGLLIVYL